MLARRNPETDTGVLAVITDRCVRCGRNDALKIPADFTHWYLVHSTLITKDDNKFGLIAGVHLIYVNATGFDRLKRGGSTPYPDGTMFTDDVRDFSPLEDGSYTEGA